MTVGSRSTNVKLSRSRSSKHQTVDPRQHGTFDPSGRTNVRNEERDAIPVRKVTHTSKSKLKPKRSTQLTSKVSAGQESSTNRQVHFTAPNATNMSGHPLRTVTKCESGSPSSFQQPEMDEEGSRSFVFGALGQAAGHLTRTTSRPPIVTPAGRPEDEEDTKYVRGSDGNIYAVDSRDGSLRLREEEETALTERSFTASRADASSTLQSASSKLGLRREIAANDMPAFGLARKVDRGAPSTPGGMGPEMQ
jgi:hypothetical protein